MSSGPAAASLPAWPAWDERAALACVLYGLAPPSLPVVAAAAAPAPARASAAPARASAPASAAKAAAAAAAPAKAPAPKPAAAAAPVDDGPEDATGATSKALFALLAAKGVPVATLEHAPARTSEESAAARGAPLASGAKALLLKAAKPLAHAGAAYTHVLAVISAARRADLKALKAAVGAKAGLSMEAPDAVFALTRCRPGAVPPFGSLWPGVLTVVDASLREQGETMNFNAGLRSLSVVNMRVADYLAAEPHRLERFTTEAPPEAAAAAAAAAAGGDAPAAGEAAA